jgi:hypothetical protein
MMRENKEEEHYQMGESPGACVTWLPYETASWIGGE